MGDSAGAQPHAATAATTAIAGLVGLASAMGIGRFAFTPLLPLMQQAGSITLSQGAYLASANYLGYLVGAVASFLFAIPAGAAARWGLVAVAASTLAAAFAHSLVVWLMLRFIAGAASAFVLIGISAWALALLARHDRPHWSGWVFAGVGAGICLAGNTAFIVPLVGASASQAWAALGAFAVAAAVATWRSLARLEPAARLGSTGGLGKLDTSAWIMIVCYGVFGFGYILPATFIPAAARALAPDPTLFAMAWPVFGLAAAASTVAVPRFAGHFSPRTVAAASLVVMGVGVLLPVIVQGLAALCISAVLVGGTFMVATMACVQEARRIGGVGAGGLIAAMTAAFAIGQLIGPLAVTSGKTIQEALLRPSIVAGVLLLLSGVALALQRGASGGASGARPVQEGADAQGAAR